VLRTALSLIVLSLLAGRAPAQTGGQRFFGVLEEFGGILTCDVIRTDEGALFALQNVGDFELGDRIVVSASSVTNVVCNQSVLPRLANNTIAPAFAGVGRIADRLGRLAVLDVPGGGRYALSDDGGLPIGAEVYVHGAVLDLGLPPGADPALGIEVESVGPGFAEFGRLELDGEGWRLATELQSVPLERMGLGFAAPGEFVYVEGRLAPNWNTAGQHVLGVSGAAVGGKQPQPHPLLVRDNVVGPAIARAGVLVDVGGETRFQAEGLVFHDLFALGDTAGFALGERLFVRGRALTDYDPLEDRSLPKIRRARLDREWTGCGTLVAAGLGEASVWTEAGELLRLENDGGFPDGAYVHVAGARSSPDSPAFLHNNIVPCAELTGRLEIGFGCSPVFVSDTPVPGASNVFFPENNGGFALGEPFCVKGGISACGAGCSVPCLVANTAEACR